MDLQILVLCVGLGPGDLRLTGMMGDFDLDAVVALWRGEEVVWWGGGLVWC